MSVTPVFLEKKLFLQSEYWFKCFFFFNKLKHCHDLLKYLLLLVLFRILIFQALNSEFFVRELKS